MSFERTNVLWNHAVGLSRPTMKTLLALGCSAEPIFQNSWDLLSIGDNLAVRTEVRSGISLENRRLVSVILAVKQSAFVGGQVSGAALPSFKIIGCKVPCSAQMLLDCIRSQEDTGLELATELDRYTLYYGGALSFLFLPEGGIVTDPKATELVVIEYYYEPRFVGRSPATIHPV